MYDQLNYETIKGNCFPKYIETNRVVEKGFYKPYSQNIRDRGDLVYLDGVIGEVAHIRVW